MNGIYSTLDVRGTVLLRQQRVALHQHMRCVGTTTCEKVHNVCDHQLTAVDSVDSDVFSLVMFFVFSDVQLSFAVQFLSCGFSVMFSVYSDVNSLVLVFLRMRSHDAS